jgi:hypothetical protein
MQLTAERVEKISRKSRTRHIMYRHRTQTTAYPCYAGADPTPPE